MHNLAFGYVELAKLTADNDEKMAKCRAAEKPLKDAFYLQTSPYTSPKLRTESFLAHIYNAQGRIYLESRQYAQAFDYFEKASRIDPNEAFLWACQAAARALENISDQTIGVFCNKFLDCLGVSETIRRRASGSIKELINEYGLHNNNHLQRLAGIGSFLEELKKEEDNAQYLENKYQDLKHFKDKSWECAQVAIKLGKLHLNNQNPVEAAKYFQAALEKLQGEFPQEIRRQELRTWLAQCRRARHEQPQEEINMLENLKALEDIKQALVMNPLSSSLRKELGCTYFCLCRFAEARDALEDALFWGANDPEIYHYLGRSYFHLVQTSHDFPQRTAGLEKAGEYLRNALALYNPEKTTGPGEMKESQQISQTHYWLGQVSLELNRPEPAITSLMIAGNLQDALQEEAPLVDLELSALEQGGIAEASLEQLAPEPACPRTMTSATLSRDEKTLPDTQFWLGGAFLKNKNFNAAENLFQELIQKYGSQAGKLEFLIKARLYYAFSLAERRGNSLTALQYLKEAHDELAALPQPLQQKLLAFYNECEGWIYYKRDKKQDINKSIISLEKAVSLWAEAGSYYRLALAYESGLEETQLEPDMDVSRKRLLRKKAQECCQHVAELDFRREYKEALEDLRNRLKPPETEETSEKSQ